MDSRARGRIIVLGDGNQILTDSDHTEMYDHVDDDKDLENQVVRGQTAHVDPTADAVATPETMSPRSEETHPSTTASKDS